MNELEQALLTLVPVYGSNIGNQSLLEHLKEQFPQLREDAFWTARDGLIEQGGLYNGCGLGDPMLRAQPVASSLAEQVINKARERFEPAAVEEVSAVNGAETAARVTKGKAAKVQPASGIEDMNKSFGPSPTSFTPISAAIEWGYYNTERPDALNCGIVLTLEEEKLKSVHWIS